METLENLENFQSQNKMSRSKIVLELETSDSLSMVD